jgi:hypothetical protein
MFPPIDVEVSNRFGKSASVHGIGVTAIRIPRAYEHTRQTNSSNRDSLLLQNSALF